MAYVGMRHVVFAPIETEVEGQEIGYGEGMVVGHAISGTVNITRNSEDLYGDDMMIESDNSIVGGTVDMTVDDMSDEVAVAMLGHVKDKSGDSYHETDAAAPYGGLGYIRVRRKNNKTQYVAYWIHKTQMGIATENSATKTQTTSWQTVAMTGKMLGVKNNADGETRFRERQSFDTEKAAIDWLQTKAGITPESLQEGRPVQTGEFADA